MERRREEKMARSLAVGLFMSLLFVLALGDPHLSHLSETHTTNPLHHESHLREHLNHLSETHHTTTETHHASTASANSGREGGGVEVVHHDSKNILEHLVNLSHQLNMTRPLHNLTGVANVTNSTKGRNRWDFSMPKPSTSPDILDVPKNPLKVSKEEWERLMPLPLKNDLKPWLKTGFNTTGFAKNCTLPELAAIAYLYDGHVWYVNSNHANNAKYRKYFKLLNVLAQFLKTKYPKLPVVRFAFSISSVASMEFNENCTFPDGVPPKKLDLPYFVLAKKKSHRLVRMPTPYFTPLWAHEAGNLYGNRIPWEQKNTSGCWIGATNTMPGGRSRLLLLAEAARLGMISDHYQDYFHVHPISHPSRRFTEWKKVGWFSNETFDLIGMSKTIAKQHTNWFGKCKYNFHMPGHTRGGYSRALQTLIPQGTAIMKYDSPWDEFYYDWLVEGVHYIPYNNDTLKEKVDYYLAHDEEGKKIGEAAAEFYTKHLTFDNILTYWEWLLLSMIRYDNDADKVRIPTNACQCFMDERRYEGRCKFCSPIEHAIRREHRKERNKRKLAKAEAAAAKLVASLDEEGEGEGDDGD